VSIFTLSHLGDDERMFFVSLLLNEVLVWMRSQKGTSSLRALLYMDEIFGFFPPVAQPPSKLPLLTLLKQARAFGLGVILATQNPVDLDYKGLSNAGTWFVGRLQTERDKARVLDGLEGASAAAGSAFDRASIDRLLSGLDKRVFLMNDVHEKAPVLFETRWTLSYLRGPLDRDELRALTGGAPARPAPPPSAARAGPARGAPRRPTLGPGVEQLFAAERGSPPAGSTLFLEPRLLGAARIIFADARLKLNVTVDDVYCAPFSDGALVLDWSKATRMELTLDDLSREPPAEAEYGEPPATAASAKSYPAWNKSFAQWLLGSRTLDLWRSPSQGTLSEPGESESAFRARLQHRVRETRDAAADALKRKYAPQVERLAVAMVRARQRVDRERSEATQAKLQTAVTVGATLLGAFLGRKPISATSLGRATTAARSAGRAMKQAQDVDLANASVEQIATKQADLDAQFQTELHEAETAADPSTETLDSVVVRPTRTRISVQVVGLLWLPSWKDEKGQLTLAL